jgi:F-type H+-transporting ATPase subunit delta
MSEIRISSRYAKSLFDLAIEQNVLEAVHNDMLLFSNISAGNPSLAGLLKSPIIDGDKKLAVLNDIFSRSFNKLSLIFLSTLVKKRREKYLPGIAAEFLSFYKELNNIITARVTTATLISDDARKQIKENLQKQTGKTIELETSVDPAIIGGIKIQVGDKLFDDSIARQLNNLKLHLLN